ncbi:sugar transporter ERD6-like 5 isoform X2 [Amborella trichopoda]|uniref:sugar transporter ERD6-like 5 isoform X2 n=1 Tax=Amborella trichopoda TaxID=13333 RepID=UPI0009BDD37A|nr:sugar transporter ERD6-like 5 isoform X2 [Amborella trichopoda]|eukprot:XP_020523686.1 sugar transporter ERD6-like 5 isoform X2 [Amborella trichopoda]
MKKTGRRVPFFSSVPLSQFAVLSNLVALSVLYATLTIHLFWVFPLLLSQLLEVTLLFLYQRDCEARMPIFLKKQLKLKFVGAGLNLLQQFGGLNGISFYATQTFVNAVVFICVQESQVSMSIVDALLMDKWGWRQLLMVSATGTCIGCLLTSISFILKDYESLQNWSPILALSGILVYTALVELGMAGIPWIIMAEDCSSYSQGLVERLYCLSRSWFQKQREGHLKNKISSHQLRS